jgi:group I intron endonuclease
MLFGKPGIYKITNTITNVTYIGQSNNISRRWQNHRTALLKNEHYCVYLQNSFNKHGITNFSCEAIEYIDEPNIAKLKVKLTEREYYWITEYTKNGIILFNIVQNPTMTPLGSSRPDVSAANTGAANHQAKLTEQQAIWLLTTDNILTYKEAVEKYNVTKACIKDLWQRRSWAHLNYPKVMKEDEPEKRSGENHPFGKLKEAEAIAILTTDKLLTIKECAEKYHVTRIVIEQLRHRKTWKQLDLPEVNTKSTVKCTGTNNKSSKLNEDAVRDIRKRLENKESCISIGKLYGVSNVTISNIRDKKIWTHVI